MARARSRATELLRRVMAAGEHDAEALAAELVMSSRTVEAILTEEQIMPLDRQLCLARFVIARVPSLERDGRMLLGQVTAALAYGTRQPPNPSLTRPM
jgi:hypothetical protein